jgi:hypothetical protein
MNARSFVLFAALAALFPSISLAQPRPEVELLEPGAEPRRPLRHNFVAGQTTRVRMRMQTQMQMQMGSEENSVPVPPIVIVTEVGPTSIPRAGRMRYAFRFTGVDIEGGDAEMREQLQTALAGVVGMHGTAEIDDRGAVQDIDLELPSNASPEVRQQAEALRQAMGQMLPPFPREPVGVGAVWRSRSEISLPQMSIAIHTIHTLRSWNQSTNEIMLDVRIERASGSGTGQLPPEVTVEITGNGRTQTRLGTLRSRTRMRTRASIRVPSPQGELRIRLESSQELTPAR